MATRNTYKVSGAPFDIVEFALTPGDVADLFDIDADFQRTVRKGSVVIAGIQRTLTETKTLRSLIHIYPAPEAGRWVVIDGKHRLFALQHLTVNLRCTLYAVAHRLATEKEATRLFEELNKSLPPGFGHFLRLQGIKGSPGLALLNELPFPVTMTGWNCRNTGAATVSQILNIIAVAFADFDRLNRFTVEGALEQLRREHIQLLARFAGIFQTVAGPVARKNVRYRLGWFDVLFRIFVQNVTLSLTDAEWSDRILALFNARHTAAFYEQPRVALHMAKHRRQILDALSERLPRIEFDAAAAPRLVAAPLMEAG